MLAACLVMDGFDVQVLGYAAPAIIEEWGIPKTDLTPVFGAGLLGLFVGSILVGMAADRLGPATGPAGGDARPSVSSGSSPRRPARCRRSC